MRRLHNNISSAPSSILFLAGKAYGLSLGLRGELIWNNIWLGYDVHLKEINRCIKFSANRNCLPPAAPKPRSTKYSNKSSFIKGITISNHQANASSTSSTPAGPFIPMQLTTFDRMTSAIAPGAQATTHTFFPTL